MFLTSFLSSPCCVPLDPCLSIPHSLSPKPVGQRWTPVRVCNSKGYGTFLVSFTPSNRAGWVGCQVTYPQTTGQGQGTVACREASGAFLKGWFLSTAPCRRFRVSTCVLGFLLSLRTRKSSRHSKKSEGGFQVAQILFGIPN